MSSAAKPGEPTCGDFGGRLGDGSPCMRRAGWGVVSPYARKPEGCCKDHLADGRKAAKDAETTQRMQAMKTAIVDALLANEEPTVTEICAAVTYQLGDSKVTEAVHPTTVWRWRQDDPAFDKDMHQALRVREAIQVVVVEGSLYQRIKRGEAAAAECIFWLINRAKDRWRDVRRIEHADAGLDERQILARLLGIQPQELPDDLSQLGKVM